MTRRSFLKGVTKGLGAVAAASVLDPTFLLAQSTQAGIGNNLILINLAGGCDGLMLYPYYEGPAAIELRRIRPTIDPTDGQILRVFSQNGVASKLGLHPSFAPLQSAISNSGAIVQKYGIVTDPGRSHDLCSQIIDLGVGSPSPSSRGFMARFADRQNLQLFQYWGFSQSAGYFAFNTERAIPLVVESLDEFALKDLWRAWGDFDAQFIAETRSALTSLETPTSSLQERYRRSLAAVDNAVLTVRNDVASQAVGMNPAGHYSQGPIGRGLRDAAKVLKAKETRASLGGADKLTTIYLTQGGYDHHSDITNPDNESNFATLTQSLATNLAVFIQDLKAVGAWNKTAIVLFSEFGRTTHENGTVGNVSVGTDHGWGSATLVLGGSVRAGVYGDVPTAGELANEEVNALVPTTDYRDIFSEIFQWVGVPPKEIFDEPDYSPKSLGLFV